MFSVASLVCLLAFFIAIIMGFFYWWCLIKRAASSSSSLCRAYLLNVLADLCFVALPSPPSHKSPLWNNWMNMDSESSSAPVQSTQKRRRLSLLFFLRPFLFQNPLLSWLNCVYIVIVIMMNNNKQKQAKELYNETFFREKSRCIQTSIHFML